MKRVKKVTNIFLIILFVFIFKISNISAASCKISVSAPSSVTVGQNFNVTVTVSSNAALGSWNYTLGYDSSKAKFNSGTLHVVDYGNGSKKSSSYSYSFKALKSGSVTFKPSNASVLDFSSESECLSGTGSATVKMRTQAEIEATYSKNNNLSSITVDGATLSPAFSPNVTEYSVTLPIDTTKAIVHATAQDKTASISGTGEIDVQDGINKVLIEVTAQHGEKQTYTLNITVQELDPVSVTIDGKKYTIVRKKSKDFVNPTGFEDKNIKIENQEINAFYNSTSRITLVNLKDEKGDTYLFVYDEKTKKYEEFKNVTSNSLNLVILDENNGNLPTDFEKANIEISSKKVTAYKYKNSSSKYYLVYAMNIENGKKDYYLYDSSNNTYQIYFEDIENSLTENIKNREYIILGLGALSLILFISLIIKCITSKKNKNKKSKYDFDEEDEEENTVEIKKIEKNEYEPIRKSRKQMQQELEEAKKNMNSKKKTIKRITLDEEE